MTVPYLSDAPCGLCGFPKEHAQHRGPERSCAYLGEPCVKSGAADIEHSGPVRIAGDGSARCRTHSTEVSA